MDDKEFNRRLRWCWVVVAGLYVVLLGWFWLAVEAGAIR